MTDTSFFPEADAAARLLSGIVGRDIKVKGSPPLDLEAPAPKVYGVYFDSNANETCLCVLDYPFAAFIGGAMLRFPKYVVEEAIKTNCLGEGLLDTAQEILNICAQMFHTTWHMTLHLCCLNRAELPENAAALLLSSVKRMDIEASIADWGSGHMTLLVGDAAKSDR